MTQTDEILKIIQTEYVYLQEIDKEIQTADKINELFEQRILEFTKWKDENYRLSEDKFYYKFLSLNPKTREQLFNEWNNLNNK